MFRRILTFVFLTFALVANATASSITGKIVTPNTAVGVSNGTLTLTLNQAATVAGSFSVASTSVSCSTSTDGSVVGLPNPVVAPLATVAGAAGSLAGVYFVKISYYASGVETLTSPAYTATVSGGNTQIVVSAPVLQPSNATGYKVYVTAASGAVGTETLQATTSGWGSTTINTVSAGAALPASNTSICSVVFNDTLIPYGTWYNIAMVDVNGSSVNGFPQRWVLQGSSVDLTNGFPLANVANSLRFPTALILNPSSNASQSVNSPLTLNGYSLTAGSLLLPDNATPSACAAGRAVIWENSSHVLQACQNGGSAQNLIAAIVNGWTQNGTDIRPGTTSNSVVTGVATSDLTTQGGGSGSGVEVGTFHYFVDAATNAHVLAIGMLASGNSYTVGGVPAGLIGITSSGAQTGNVPLLFTGCDPLGTCPTQKEYGRMDVASSSAQWKFGDIALQTSEDAITGVVIVRKAAGLTVTNAATNAQTARLYLSSGNLTLEAGTTGAGAAHLMQFKTNGTTACSIDTSQNLLCGTQIADDATGTVVEAVRSSTVETSIAAWNSANTTTGYASLYVTAGAVFGTNRMSVGVTDAAYTISGAYYPNMGFLQSNAGTTNGILVDAVAGPIALRSNGTTEMSVTGGTGVVAAHYVEAPGGLRAYGQAVVYPTGTQKMLNGYFDTGANTAFVASSDYAGCPGACAPVYYPLDLASSKLIVNISGTDALWVVTGGLQWPTGFGSVVGGIAVKSAAPTYPAGGTSYGYLYNDSTASNTTFLVSADYAGPTYKNLILASAQMRVNISGTDTHWFTATGLQWKTGTTALAAGATTMSIANLTFPGVGGSTIPYRWLTAIAEDGTTVYIPAWR